MSTTKRFKKGDKVKSSRNPATEYIVISSGPKNTKVESVSGAPFRKGYIYTAKTFFFSLV